MAHFDVFNGDADGICALLQLRLAEPKVSTLVTGVKRDINLLARVNAQASDTVTVLDVSFDKNHLALQRLLSLGVSVFYCDHHQADTLFEHPNLQLLHNAQANVCTSLLVNGYLHSAYPEWAIVGAYGDNLHGSAQQLAKYTQLGQQELAQLEQLGVAINYNAYGTDRADLHFQPEDLYQQLYNYKTPLDFVQSNSKLFSQLIENYQFDLQKVQQIQAVLNHNSARAFVLPNAAFSRRVSGVFANQLANQAPEKAHAVITDLGDIYQVSVRAPLNQRFGAARLCAEFATGGGREAAAGINRLAKDQLATFIQRFSEFYA